jgi:hypothetical protein
VCSPVIFKGHSAQVVVDEIVHVTLEGPLGQLTKVDQKLSVYQVPGYGEENRSCVCSSEALNGTLSALCFLADMIW